MKRSILVIAFICLVLRCAAVAYARAQFTLENRINKQLNLFVDGAYACGPVMTNGGICTTQITSGVVHKFEARAGMDPNTTVMTQTRSVPDGASPTMVVCYLDPKTGRCPGS
jgi:hypothetical protein